MQVHLGKWPSFTGMEHGSILSKMLENVDGQTTDDKVIGIQNYWNRIGVSHLKAVFSLV